MDNKPCPCGSNTSFTECCARILKDHSLAKTAEQLMRSRYTAFTLKDNTYLLKSWAKESRPEHLNVEEAPVQWLDLKVENSKEGQEQDSTGTVTFTARFISSGHLCHLREESRFVREENKWFYLDGTPESSTAKISRNGKCPCGSGKKYKRCCL